MMGEGRALVAMAMFVLGLGSASALSGETRMIESIDFSEIRTIAVRGVGAHIVFNASEDGAYGMTQSVSGWSRYACGKSAVAHREGNTLIIEVASSGIGIFWGCDFTLVVSAPPTLDIDVALDKSVLDMNGPFEDIFVRSSKTVICIDGSAHDVRLDGDKAVVSLRLNNERQNGEINLVAQEIVADLAFGSHAAVSYVIDAPIQLFDRGMANQPTASRHVNIKARMLKGSIRARGDESVS